MKHKHWLRLAAVFVVCFGCASRGPVRLEIPPDGAIRVFVVDASPEQGYNVNEVTGWFGVFSECRKGQGVYPIGAEENADYRMVFTQEDRSFFGNDFTVNLYNSAGDIILNSQPFQHANSVKDVCDYLLNAS